MAKSMLHNLLGRHLLKRSFLHATSDAERDALSGITQPVKLFNIPNFVYIAPVHIQKKNIGPVFKLLFFSRIEEKKGLDILLQALPLLTIPYQLTIAGDGDPDYVAQLKTIADNNLSSAQISWIGFQNEDKFAVYSNHHLFVLPSHNENFGNVVIESLSAGTPVLISEHVGLANYITENSLGWVCKTLPSSVANTINDIAINQKDKLGDISLKAAAIIRKDFDEEPLIKKYIKMYQEIIKHGQL